MAHDGLEELRQIVPPRERGMAARFGVVAYWFGNGLACLWGALMLFALAMGRVRVRRKLFSLCCSSRSF